MTLKDFFTENPKCAIGFSGGVDSAYLLYAGKKFGADIQPYYIKTPFQPQFEYDDALRVCETIGVSLKVIEHNILSEPNIIKNPTDRCYYCKKAMFSLLCDNAKKDGYNIVIDGTNASDDVNDRPGMRAIRELSVKSPLRECGLTKNEIRVLSKNAGLFTWDKPAYACLATRIPHGVNITRTQLENIEKAENEMMAMGFSDFRVRLYGNAARLQIKDNQFEMAVNNREEIIRRLKPYFDTILLDMEAR